jgi:hypothetical protein
LLLQIEGQPVQRPTVIAYLNSAYQCVFGEPFRGAAQKQQEDTASQTPNQQPGDAEQQADQQQVPPQGASSVTTFAAMTQLLLFADAVGSTAPLLRACAAGIEKLNLQVTWDWLLPTEAPLDLSIETPYFLGTISDSNNLQLSMVTEEQSVLALAEFSEEEAPAAKAALQRQIQAQAEALLFAAYKLQLADAAEAVQGFISMQTCFMNSVLHGALRPVLSRRVLDAAAGYRSLQETLLVNHLVTRPCAFSGMGPLPAALVPIAIPADQRLPVTCTAEAMQDVLGSSKGQQVEVEVDLFNLTMKMGEHTHRAHLLLGNIVADEDSKLEMLGPPA